MEIVIFLYGFIAIVLFVVNIIAYASFKQDQRARHRSETAPFWWTHPAEPKKSLRIAALGSLIWPIFLIWWFFQDEK